MRITTGTKQINPQANLTVKARVVAREEVEVELMRKASRILLLRKGVQRKTLEGPRRV